MLFFKYIRDKGFNARILLPFKYDHKKMKNMKNMKNIQILCVLKSFSNNKSTLNFFVDKNMKNF